jgi:hypothetical protein
MSSSPTKEIHPSVIAIAKRLHDYNEPALHHVQNTQSNQFGHSKLHNEPGVRTSSGFIFVGPSGETDKARFNNIPNTINRYINDFFYLSLSSYLPQCNLIRQKHNWKTS